MADEAATVRPENVQATESTAIRETWSQRQVLTTGPSETGGLYRKAVSPAGVTAMMRSIASELLDQHQLVFGSTAKPGTVSKITMSIRRPGITLRAPSYAVSRNSR